MIPALRVSAMRTSSGGAQRQYGRVLHDAQDIMALPSGNRSQCTIAVNTDAAYCRPGKSRSIAVTATNTAPSFRINLGGSASGNTNLSQMGDISIWVWCPWVRNAKSCVVDFVDGGGNTARFTMNLRQGLNQLILRRTDVAYSNFPGFTHPASACDWTNIRYFTIQMSSVTAGDVWYFCGAEIGYRAKGVIINTSDDGRLDAITNWKTLLDERGFKATAYIVGGEIGNANYTTQTTLDAWHDAGHDVAYHSWGNLLPGTNSLSVATMLADIDTHRAYAIARGYTRNNEHLLMSYNGGEDTANFRTALSQRGFLSGRLAAASNAGGDAPSQYWLGDRLGVYGYLVAEAGAGGETVAKCLQQIDQAVHHGLVLQLIWHRIATPNPDTTIGVTIADATTILDHQAKYKRLGMCDVLNMTEWMSR